MLFRSTKESVQETLREFRDVHGARPLTRDEFEGAKAGVLRAYPASFERPAQVLNQLVQLVLYDLPDDYFHTFRERIEGVSLAEVHRIAAERVQPDRLKMVVVGDRQATELGLRQLELPLVILDADGNETS